MLKCFPLFIVFVLFSCNVDPVEVDKVSDPDIVYSWLKSIQLTNGLVPSYEYSHFQDREMGYEISLYDNALAIIAFSYKGDLYNAEKVLDFFNKRVETEFDISPGGFSQFRYPSNGTPNSTARWIGDNAWLLIAINHYHNLSGNTNYTVMANKLSAWLIKLQDQDDGGLWAGYDSDGKIIDNKVIEGNIDAFNAITGYNDSHISILNYLKTNRWNNDEKLFVPWPNSNFEYALDISPWAYCTLPNFPKSTIINTTRFKTTMSAEYNNNIIQGFCVDEDRDTVWLEGTGEMVVSYNKAQMFTDADFYIEEMEKILIPSPENSELYGLPYATNSSGTYYGAGDLNEYTAITPWVSSTVWYLFATDKFDPFTLGIKDNLSAEQYSWE